jgi:hypothetical protein
MQGSLAGLAEASAGEHEIVAFAPTSIRGPERIRAALGWQPRFDDLETIVRSQLEWEFRLLREPALQKN